MISINVTGQDGTARQVTGSAGQTVMEVIRNEGFDEMLALCGGCCSCASCHVFVDKDYLSRLPRPTEDENDLLDSSSFRNANSRLACQLPLSAQYEGMAVTIAPGE